MDFTENPGTHNETGVLLFLGLSRVIFLTVIFPAELNNTKLEIIS